MQPTPRQRRGVFAVIGASTLIFLLAAPFAEVQLPHVWAFLPVYQTAQVVTALITGMLLLGQSRILQSWPLLVLAGGYLFGAAMAVAHAASFPDLFAPAGLLGAGPQTTAWLYFLWHGGFALFVAGYGLLKRRPHPVRLAPPQLALATAGGAVAVLVLAGSLILLATVGEPALPVIMDGNRDTPAKLPVAVVTWLLGCAALAILGWRKPRSLLDLWVVAVMCAWLYDTALSALLNQGRFDLGWYAGRVSGVLADSLVLVMLVFENNVLYSRLVRLHARERRRSAEALRRSELRFRTLFDKTNVAIYLHDPDSGAILDANPSALAQHGCRTLEELRGRHTWLDPPYSFADAVALIRAASAGGEQHIEWKGQDGRGEIYWEEILLTRITLDAAERVLAICTDVTERRRLHQALEEREAQYRAIIETTGDGFWMLDGEGRLLAVNDAYVQRSGYDREELLGLSATDLDANEHFETVHAHMEKVRHQGRNLFETRHRAKDGSTWPVEVNVAYWQSAGGRYFAFLRDITDRKALEREIIEVSTSEQVRIGHDIHDGIGQQLTGLTMLAGGLQRRLTAVGHTQEATAAAELRGCAQAALAEARALARGLAPLELDREGLAGALAELTRRISDTGGIQCRYLGPGNLRLADGAMATHLYRIAQEAVQNALKHAHAARVEVRLEPAAGLLVLSVRDDGLGFHPEQVRRGRLGLHIMGYRAGILGGTCRVGPAEGGGTLVRCEVPLGK